MATKAEMNRYFEERSGPDKPARVKRSRNPARPAGVKNWSRRAGRNQAEWGLERMAPGGKPSRKTTRHSTRGMKPSHPNRSAGRNKAMFATTLGRPHR